MGAHAMGLRRQSSVLNASRKLPAVFFLGAAAVVSKLLFLPFARFLPSDLLSVLSDALLCILLAMAAWQASRRSTNLANVLWLGFFVTALLWAISFAVAALALASNGRAAAMASFWPSTIVFFLVGIVLTVPLLLSESDRRAEIDWLFTCDIAQLAIVTFCAYLLLFYIPVLTSTSESFRIHRFIVSHGLRDGFLAAGFLYRGWRSPSPALHRLQWKIAAFFLAFSAAGSLEIYFYEQATPSRALLLDFVASLPVFFLLFLAATWEQPAEAAFRSPTSAFPKGLLWTQFMPVLLPAGVILLASRIVSPYLRLAWIAVAASVACYTARLMIMQHRQEVSAAALRALEEKFRKAFKVSPVALAISRLADGFILDVNDRFLEMFQSSKEQLVGKTSIGLGIWASPDDRMKFVHEIDSKGFVRDVPINIRLAGKICAVLASGELIELDRQPVVITALLDVTELRNATQQLQQVQKMELVGQLAGGIAHDFNNLLTVIKGYAELSHNRDSQAAMASDVREISKATDKAAALTKELLAFSRRQVLQPRNITMNSVISGIEAMLRRMVPENIELVMALAHDPGTVYADPSQLEHVLMNLAANARDAMPKGGRLCIATRNLDLTSAYEERDFEIPAGRYVILEVTDTGTGIEPEFMGRIFEPFFTTKEAGRGTGLGLSTVYGIVKQSGGYVWAYSEPNAGATFKICLPSIDEAADEVALQASVTPSVLGGNETVLLVEDDNSVRELVAKILVQYGYHVIAAASGTEAIRLGRQYESEIHLLLTDVIMPDGSGKDLTDLLRDLMPRLRVLYMSGYPHVPSAGSDTMDFHDAFLAKPFAPAELASRVRETLDLS